MTQTKFVLKSLRAILKNETVTVDDTRLPVKLRVQLNVARELDVLLEATKYFEMQYSHQLTRETHARNAWLRFLVLLVITLGVACLLTETLFPIIADLASSNHLLEDESPAWLQTGRRLRYPILAVIATASISLVYLLNRRAVNRHQNGSRQEQVLLLANNLETTSGFDAVTKSKRIIEARITNVGEVNYSSADSDDSAICVGEPLAERSELLNSLAAFIQLRRTEREATSGETPFTIVGLLLILGLIALYLCLVLISFGYIADQVATQFQ